YLSDPVAAARHTAKKAVESEKLKGSSPGETADATSASILATIEARTNKIEQKVFDYSDFCSVQEAINGLPGICSLISYCSKLKGKEQISADDYKVACRVVRGGMASRPQADFIFQLFDLNKDGYISPSDAMSVTGVDFYNSLKAVKGRDGWLTFAPPTAFTPKTAAPAASAKAEKAKSPPKPTTFVGKLVDFFEHFALGALAGGIGAAAVYPIDLVKTRMQNQRVVPGKEAMYRSSWDCFKKTLKAEGAVGMYSGLLPQMLGVAPEKAIKLTVNDLLRATFTTVGDDGDDKIALPLEVLSGAGAGFAQVFVTNPLEITKIRLQMQGEDARVAMAAGKPRPDEKTFFKIAQELGIKGLYKGAGACWARDVPFSAIYFPAYAYFKHALSEGGDPSKTTPFSLFAAGMAAGVPAAFLTTPFDVIKTRLQVVARDGEMKYTGMLDCAGKLMEAEGIGAFFKGSGMRVFRSSPQFGITLMSYEMLSSLVYGKDGNKNASPPTNAPIVMKDYYSAFPRSNQSVGGKFESTTNMLAWLGQQPPEE
ncbi:hypothetical protein TeGR_g11991, partial [Tetraparma gracilis]